MTMLPTGLLLAALASSTGNPIVVFACAADFDQDGAVDVEDLHDLARFIDSGDGVAGDLTGDCESNLADVAVFQRHVGGECSFQLTVKLEIPQIVSRDAPFQFIMHVTNVGMSTLGDYPVVNLYLSKDERLDPQVDKLVHTNLYSLPVLEPGEKRQFESLPIVLPDDATLGPQFAIIAYRYQPTGVTYYDDAELTIVDDR